MAGGARSWRGEAGEPPGERHVVSQVVGVEPTPSGLVACTPVYDGPLWAVSVDAEACGAAGGAGEAAPAGVFWAGLVP